MRISMRAALRLALAAFVGLAGSASLATQARAAGGPENSLPGTTLFFAKVNDSAALRDAFTKTSFGQLLADPAMKPFASDFLEKMDEASKALKGKLGLTVNELLTLPQGAASIAIIAKGEGKIPVAVVIHADAGKNADKMTELMTKITAMTDKDKVSTEMFNSLTLTTLKTGKDDAPPLIWTKNGTVFHIASDAAVLKDVISHADGRDDSLAKSENFMKVTKKLGEGQAYWFIDMNMVVKLAVKVASASNPGQNPEPILQILGINGLKAAGGTLAFNSPQYDTVSKIFIYAPGPVQGVLKMFAMPKVNLRPEPWVPSTVSSYQTMSWDLDALFAAVNDLANMFNPGMLDVVQQQLVGSNGGEPLNFQKDIFGPLGDRITMITDFKKPIKEDSQRLLVGIALEDAKKFQATLGKIIAIANGTPKTREFQGTTIYDFAIPQMPNQAPNSPLASGTVSLAIAKDTLFVATEPSLLEAVLRGGKSGSTESARPSVIGAASSSLPAWRKPTPSAGSPRKPRPAPSPSTLRPPASSSTPSAPT